MPANEHAAPPLTLLADFYASESSNLRKRFEASGDGLEFIRARADLVDDVAAKLYGSMISARLDQPSNFCLLAVGGFGRRELFPFSDIDLLFLGRDETTLKTWREVIAAIAKDLWDLRLRVGHSARTLADCAQLHRDNLEFSISLLDVRYLAGDKFLFEELRSQAILRLVARDQQDLVRDLIDLSLKRHAKYGKTIFHLEPDVKQAPGGLRDFHVARWLALINGLAESGSWGAPEGLWASGIQESAAESIRFLSAVRCFLHLEHGRNDNLLTYEAQEKAAGAGLGLRYGEAVDPAEWMQQYYLRVRSIHRLASRQMEEAFPPRSSLYGLFQDWRSRLSNTDFSVIRGKIFPRAAPPRDLPALLRLFEMSARHGLELSREAERWAEESLRNVKAQGANALSGSPVWSAFRPIMGLPHAANALRAMHRLGLVTALFPEFQAADTLVIRDDFHRYTVDEHSFVAIQTLCELSAKHKESGPDSEDAGGSSGAWEGAFAGIFSEIERPDLLCFALLFHDVGKGMDAPAHIEGSLHALRQICARLEMEREEADTVCFLVAHHLEMSATMLRRDIFDPEIIRSLAEKVGVTERLKMLCLFTYADIKAVNPEALTPWKAEMLWQLYTMTFNHLSRSLDQDRVHTDGELAVEIRQGLPSLAKDSGEFRAFLEGFPTRYLSTHTPQEIVEHFEWARQIQRAPVQVRVQPKRRLNELTVLTTDRPSLFASITGTLAAWGMNILKADAFANSSGIVIDTFRFHDLFRTLELNPSERERLETNISEVLTGGASVPALMAGRQQAAPPARIKVKTRISFDDVSSNRCSLMELIAQDRPGLLFQVSSTLADLGCNIEVALVDTESQKAIDVFYLTFRQSKLSPQLEEAIRTTLLAKLTSA